MFCGRFEGFFLKVAGTRPLPPLFLPAGKWTRWLECEPLSWAMREEKTPIGEQRDGRRLGPEDDVLQSHLPA